MATRGIIAVKRAQGWRGRYVHWDNNPKTRIPTIVRLVERDGLAKVVETLIDRHGSWSSINPYQEPNDSEIGSVVAGYGVAHTDIDPNSETSWFTERDHDLAWTEYVYIMSKDGLQVCQVVQDGDREQAEPTNFYTWEQLREEVTV